MACASLAGMSVACGVASGADEGGVLSLPSAIFSAPDSSDERARSSARSAFLPPARENIFHCVHDRLVAGAAAVVAREVLADLFATGIRTMRDEVQGGH